MIKQKSKKCQDMRPGWDEYFLGIIQEVAKRATCDRGKAGCVIVKDKRILATGYVGSPAGQLHCDEAGHMMRDVVAPDGSMSKHCIRTIHAEQNAICQAARFGIPLEGSTLYCKMEPCFTCAKMIVNCGIKRVVCESKYHAAAQSRDLFKKAKVALSVLSNAVVNYKDQK
ncbi:MAG: cell division protein DedD [Omnitrophica WOR_2 bacterium GWF2_43_52]|nr:MAG: cell division protein DedD [Omnitrophica WOR_2 bacterium GWA2_44_7]OGX22722.1 MAG: cell division protein DedD [Omnitrophica WOR_2 bacterium GWF2_43_52]HAH20241.1 cell division protein DedD [Candidatus Omnitrophota bacterium]HBG63355.1 cell division protein DedD [Candidatus Omnitrophota bacterium]